MNFVLKKITPFKHFKYQDISHILVLSSILIFLFIFSFIWGQYDIPISKVICILFNNFISLIQKIIPCIPDNLHVSCDYTSTMETIIINIRLPRIILACLVGCCLSCAGLAYQNVFQNPMASPDILGASSGACFGAALAIWLGLPKNCITILAFGFSLTTIVIVYLISSHTRGNQVVNILLAGIMVSFLFSAATSYIKLIADPTNQLPEITYWMMGSLSSARFSEISFIIWPMLIALIPLLLLRWRLNILTLNDKESLSMGVNVKKLRFAVIFCATLLTASSVSVSGMIAWVGLIIPNLGRKIIGNDCRHLLPSLTLMGAIFLLLVDDLSRNLFPTELPIGILTAFIGAPFFIYLMTRRTSLN